VRPAGPTRAQTAPTLSSGCGARSDRVEAAWPSRRTRFAAALGRTGDAGAANDPLVGGGARDWRFSGLFGRPSALASLLALLVLAAACSPEATRTRGGGPGADVGNHGDPLRLHERIDPSYQEPIVGRAVRR
jgi:hypothetical protein